MYASLLSLRCTRCVRNKVSARSCSAAFLACLSIHLMDVCEANCTKTMGNVFETMVKQKEASRDGRSCHIGRL